jgi:hypothetical protein
MNTFATAALGMWLAASESSVGGDATEQTPKTRRQARTSRSFSHWEGNAIERLGGIDARPLVCDESSRDAAEALTARDRAVHIANFAVAPADLTGQLADPLRARHFAHDVLFAANPDTKDPHRWAPSYRTWNPEFETMTVQSMDEGVAFARFGEIAAAGSRRAFIDLGKARTALRAVTKGLRGDGRRWRCLWAHWDNRDDTAFDGVILIDLQSGELRVAMTNDFA